MEPDAVEPAAHRRPVPRDRVWVHAVWEVLLAAAVVVAVLALRRENSQALSGGNLRDLLLQLSAAVLLGSGFALSLRAAVPNLAVGAVAMIAGILTGWLRTEHGYQLRVAVLITLGAAVVLGLVLSLITVGLRLPGWAVGLGASFGLVAAALSLAGGGRTQLLDNGPDLRPWAWALAGGAVALSLIGGVFGLTPRARAAIGRYRPAGDAAAGRGARAAVTATLALTVSTVMAAGAGLIIALRQQAVIPNDGFGLLALAAAVAFLGGTSAYGRRGGLFGTVLAAAFLQLGTTWLLLRQEPSWAGTALLGGAVVLGLIVGRLVEAAGSTEPEELDRFDDDDAGPETQMWDPYSTGSFQPGSDPYPTGGGFTPASAYRPGGEPYWPGQAPVHTEETTREEGAQPSLGTFREPGRELGQFRGESDR